MIWVLNFQIIKLGSSYLPFKAWRFVLGSALPSQKNSLRGSFQMSAGEPPFPTEHSLRSFWDLDSAFVPLSLMPSQDSAPHEFSREIQFHYHFVSFSGPHWRCVQAWRGPLQWLHPPLFPLPFLSSTLLLFRSNANSSPGFLPSNLASLMLEPFTPTLYPSIFSSKYCAIPESNSGREKKYLYYG